MGKDPSLRVFDDHAHRLDDLIAEERAVLVRVENAVVEDDRVLNEIAVGFIFAGRFSALNHLKHFRVETELSFDSRTGFDGIHTFLFQQNHLPK